MAQEHDDDKVKWDKEIKKMKEYSSKTSDGVIKATLMTKDFEIVARRNGSSPIHFGKAGDYLCMQEDGDLGILYGTDTLDRKYTLKTGSP